MTHNLLSTCMHSLKECGYFYLPNQPVNSATRWAEVFGSHWLRDEVKEHPNGKKLRETCNAIDLHSDPAGVHYLMYVCRQAAGVGGEVLLADGRKILNSLNPKVHPLLREIEVICPRVFGSEHPTTPILQVDSAQQMKQCYYAPWHLLEPHLPPLKQALGDFLNGVNTAPRIELKLNPGDLLIIDNTRMLHGRRSFGRNSGRWLTRYWIPSGQSVSG